MNRNLLYLVLFIILIAISCGQPPVEEAAESITAESLMRHIEIISSDEYEGRAPATRGEDLTVD